MLCKETEIQTVVRVYVSASHVSAPSREADYPHHDLEIMIAYIEKNTIFALKTQTAVVKLSTIRVIPLPSGLSTHLFWVSYPFVNGFLPTLHMYLSNPCVAWIQMGYLPISLDG